MRTLRISLAVAAFASLATLSRAAVAFSDLSATSPYYFGNAAYLVGGSLHNGGSATYGAEFTSTLSGGITSVFLGLSLVAPGDGNVNVYLEPVPSTPGLVNLNTAVLLGTATTTTPFPSDGSQLTNVTLAAVGLISLTANQQYYLILQPGDPNTDARWNLNNTSATGNLFYSSDLGVTFTAEGHPSLPAFEIDVASVPEPSSFALSLPALFAAAIAVRLRKSRCAA